MKQKPAYRLGWSVRIADKIGLDNREVAATGYESILFLVESNICTGFAFQMDL